MSTIRAKIKKNEILKINNHTKGPEHIRLYDPVLLEYVLFENAVVQDYSFSVYAVMIIINDLKRLHIFHF